MYLEEIYLENTGPISKCHVEKMPFDNEGNPLPVVVVGANGSGKSTFLSYVLDALTELAKKPFSDIVPAEAQEVPYYRVIHPMAIRSGASHSLSLQRFRTAKRQLYYGEKCGNLDSQSLSPSVKSKFDPVCKWKPNDHYKDVSADEETIKQEMIRGAHVFFPATRREDPDWLNPKSLAVPPNYVLASRATASPRGRYNDRLEKPLRVDYWAKDTDSWVLDVFLDSLVDSAKLDSNAPRTKQVDHHNRTVLRQARENVQQLLSEILQDGRTELMLNLRNAASSRLQVRLSDGRIIPSLQSLSEAQATLFNLFCTIIRYGERSDLNKSIRLSDISGIVLIDEIDAHLHASLEYDVLPKLIKLFPMVQFLVSSHSPLVLLGMEKKFGPDGFWILELPTGQRITTERYTEFVSAFAYYQETVTFEQQIEQQIENRIKGGKKPLLFTEGKSDVCYIRTALTLMGKEHLLDAIDIEPVGGEGEKGDRNGGKKGLDRVKTYYEFHPNILPRPLLLLYDCETDRLADQCENLSVRSIPRNPKNRKMTKGIENLLPELFFTKSEYKSQFYKPFFNPDAVNGEKPDKQKLCKWVCEERRNADDFDGFDAVVKILEEFVNAFQS